MISDLGNLSFYILFWYTWLIDSNGVLFSSLLVEKSLNPPRFALLPPLSPRIGEYMFVYFIEKGGKVE